MSNIPPKPDCLCGSTRMYPIGRVNLGLYLFQCLDCKRIALEFDAVGLV